MVEGRGVGWVERRAAGWWLVPLAAALIAFRHSPGFGLLSDAAFLIEENLWLRGPGALWANLTHDYFWSSSGNALPYWRPVTKGAWVLENALGGGGAWLFHLVQVALHLLATGAVMWLARELGATRGWALAAGLWYALHPSLIEPVAMVMARSDVACAAGMTAAVAAWIRWRKSGARRWADLHAVALLLALGSKETAVVLAPALTLVAFLIPARGRDPEAPHPSLSPLPRGEGEQSAVPAALASPSPGASSSPPSGASSSPPSGASSSPPSGASSSPPSGASSSPPSGASSSPPSGASSSLDWRGRWRWVGPAWAATGLYFIGRRVVLGAAASPGIDLDLARIFVGGGRYLFGLLPWRIDSAIEPIPRQLSLDPWVPVTAVLGWALFAAAVVFLWRWWWRGSGGGASGGEAPRASGWRAGGDAIVLAALVPLSLAPVLLVNQLNVPVAASRYALADRWALPAIAAAVVVLALVGTALTAARTAAGVGAAAMGAPAFVRRAVSIGAGMVTAVWVVATLALSGRTHAPFRNTDTLAAMQDARYEETPERLRALEDRCDYVERRIHRALADSAPAEALVRARAVPEGCPNPGRFSLLRLVALTQLKRFPEAAATAEQLQRQRLEPRYHGQAAYHAGLAHAETGDFARAEAELQQASRLGYRSCNLPAQLGRLLARRNALGPAAEAFERAAACLPNDPRPLLAAASLWLAAAQPARARALLGRIDPAGLAPAMRPGYDDLRAKLAAH